MRIELDLKVTERLGPEAGVQKSRQNSSWKSAASQGLIKGSISYSASLLMICMIEQNAPSTNLLMTQHKAEWLKCQRVVLSSRVALIDWRSGLTGT